MNGESFQQMVLEQLNIQEQKLSLDLSLTPNAKLISKRIVESNVNHEIIKYLEDNIGENPWVKGLVKEFLGYLKHDQ